MQPTIESKLRSVDRYQFYAIGGMALDDFCQERMGILVADAEIAEVEYYRDEHRTRIYMQGVDKDAPRVSVASAITEDGYFLTAAHSVQNVRTIKMIHGNLDSSVENELRIVWIDHKHDIALLKADVETAYFELYPLSAEDQTVVAAGGLLGGSSAGVIVRTDENPDGFFEVVHTAPVRKGDSGGPLLTPDGRLVGINYSFGFHILRGRRSYASNLDPAVLIAIIENDRKLHATEKKVTQPEKDASDSAAVLSRFY